MAGVRQGQLVPQYCLTSLTQTLSQIALQQYESALHTAAVHASQDADRLAPAAHSLCVHDPPPPPLLLPPPPLPPLLLPPPPQDCPQYWGTSLTQMLSHCELQQ